MKVRLQAARAIHACVKQRNFFKEKTSASMPPGIEKKKTGNVSAVCSKAINVGELVMEVMSQAAATMCIHVPMLEAILTIQK